MFFSNHFVASVVLTDLAAMKREASR